MGIDRDPDARCRVNVLLADGKWRFKGSKDALYDPGNRTHLLKVGQEDTQIVMPEP